MSSLVICTAQQFLLDWRKQKECDGLGV